MWQPFSKYIFSILLSLMAFSSVAKNDTTIFNPIFRDSILRNKIDSVGIKLLNNHINKEKKSTTLLIQKQKKAPPSIIFCIVGFSLLLFLLILRLIFEDFTLSMFEGLWSIKRFFIFYKSKKYSSFIAILSIYLLNIIILSLIAYVAIQYYQKNSFRSFEFIVFLKLLGILALFFIFKDILEFIFNWVINMQSAYRAFFLQLLFSEIIIASLFLVLLMVTVYNQQVSERFLVSLFVISFLSYLVFNTIRSFQLMSNIRIDYKLHFFLYICAFKVLPLLILAKFVINNVIA